MNTDILIVGSGPVGATFARVLFERLPHVRIIMLDAGPQLTPRPGQHVANIVDEQARAQAQVRSQGPSQYQYESPAMTDRAGAMAERGLRRIARLVRPGTHLVTPDDADLDMSGLPAAAL